MKAAYNINNHHIFKSSLIQRILWFNISFVVVFFFDKAAEKLTMIDK